MIGFLWRGKRASRKRIPLHSNLWSELIAGFCLNLNLHRRVISEKRTQTNAQLNFCWRVKLAAAGQQEVNQCNYAHLRAGKIAAAFSAHNYWLKICVQSRLEWRLRCEKIKTAPSYIAAVGVRRFQITAIIVLLPERREIRAAAVMRRLKIILHTTCDGAVCPCATPYSGLWCEKSHHRRGKVARYKSPRM